MNLGVWMLLGAQAGPGTGPSDSASLWMIRKWMWNMVGTCSQARHGTTVTTCSQICLGTSGYLAGVHGVKDRSKTPLRPHSEIFQVFLHSSNWTHLFTSESVTVSGFQYVLSYLVQAFSIAFLPKEKRTPQ